MSDNNHPPTNGSSKQNGSSQDPVKTMEVFSLSMGELQSQKAPTISFHDLNYEVNLREGCCAGCKNTKVKQILHSVNGFMKPGLNAIMGPTGSGKSTLLDILADRKDPAGLSGDILIDGVYLPSNFKHFSGYVVQQDVLIGTLTVRENLWYSANLRLPKSVSKEAKLKRIDEVLHDLGITACADTKIGNEMLRGVSGGEKKRTSIAMELITSPSVLFLDEPTTGLDASTANAVMIHLKRLSMRGRTVILSIHQPRFSIFRLFDNLTLLSTGRIVYHGACGDALAHFKSIGYHCEEHNNPGDFLLDVINGDSTALTTSLTDDAEIQEKNDEESTTRIASDLAAKYNSSELSKTLRDELRDIANKSHKEKKRRSSIMQHGYATPFCFQFGVLVKRTFKSVIRNPMVAVANIVISLIMGLLLGIFYYQVEDDPETGVQNRFGVLFFMTTNLMFTSINAIDVFVKERNIFIHEYVSGYYSVAAYFLARLVGDLVPMRTVSPIIFGSITYWMVGLKATASAFFTFLFFILLTGYAAVSVALFVSSSFATFAVANLAISMIFIFSVMFGGLLLNVESAMSWISWLQYLSVANYAFAGCSVNEFRNQQFGVCPVNVTTSSSTIMSSRMNDTAGNLPVPNCLTGERILASRLGVGDGFVTTEWDLWQNAIALGCITIGMFILTYIQLARTKMTT